MLEKCTAQTAVPVLILNSGGTEKFSAHTVDVDDTNNLLGHCSRYYTENLPLENN